MRLVQFNKRVMRGGSLHDRFILLDAEHVESIDATMHTEGPTTITMHSGAEHVVMQDKQTVEELLAATQEGGAKA